MCDKYFDEEWKMSAHIRNHNKYACDICEKTFKYQEILQKPIKIKHEDLKLFCHYQNNNKECPHEECCIYLHEESPICKYGVYCERELCMYRHETNHIHVGNTDKDKRNNEVFENEDVNENDDMRNITFLNPSQSEHSDDSLKNDN